MRNQNTLQLNIFSENLELVFQQQKLNKCFVNNQNNFTEFLKEMMLNQIKTNFRQLTAKHTKSLSLSLFISLSLYLFLSLYLSVPLSFFIYLSLSLATISVDV